MGASVWTRNLPAGGDRLLVALEPFEELAGRIEEAAHYVPMEQLCLSPQCGFSSTVHGNDITEDVQWAKLRLTVDAANHIWR